MTVRNDEASAGTALSSARGPDVWISSGPIGSSAARLALVPLPMTPGLAGAWARLDGTPPPGTPAPRALSFAFMPDVTCGLLMASPAAPVKYGPRMARSDGSSDDSPLYRKDHFYPVMTQSE